MPLHPQAQSMIDAFAAGPALDFSRLRASEFRNAFAAPAPSVPGPPIGRIEDRRIAGPAGPIRTRLYYPKSQGPLPIILFIHGGGFVVGDPEMTDGICKTLAATAGALVVSPDYRLAPEAPFPAGLEDSWAALCWAQDNGAAIGGRAQQVAVAGDSTGGNFAAVLAQRARDTGRPLRHQLLLYPALDPVGDTPSWTAFAEGYFLTAEMMRWYWRQYGPEDALLADPSVSPARRTDLRGLAPATIFTAEFDVLRDEAETYAARLAAARVATTLKRWDGQFHGFLLLQGAIDDADTALNEAGAALRAAFAE
jgi:acetyl esterase